MHSKSVNKKTSPFTKLLSGIHVYTSYSLMCETWMSTFICILSEGHICVVVIVATESVATTNGGAMNIWKRNNYGDMLG